jgi:hypothetical protein
VISSIKLKLFNTIGKNLIFPSYKSPQQSIDYVEMCDRWEDKLNSFLQYSDEFLSTKTLAYKLKSAFFYFFYFWG